MAIHFNHLSVAAQKPLPTNPVTLRNVGKTASSGAPASSTGSTAPSSGASDSGSTPSFYSLFPTIPGWSNTPPAAPPSAPTAQSVFGSNPWVTNPTGTNPDGSTYGYNPIYFATQQTAQAVAQMVGGQVVPENAICSAPGPFVQNQPNLMVQLPNGGMINPGLVASFYTHGYPQSMVDQMVANEVAGATPNV